MEPFLDPLCIPGSHVERFASSSPEAVAACRNFEGEVRTAPATVLRYLPSARMCI